MEAKLTTDASLVVLSKVRQFIAEHAKGICIDEGFLYDLTLAVDEVVTNIIVHGYQGKPGHIQLTLRNHSVGLEVVVLDEAPPFDPTQVPTPNVDVPLEMRKPGGLGVFLARQLTDQMEYRRLPSGVNELRLVKRCPVTVEK